MRAAGAGFPGRLFAEWRAAPVSPFIVYAERAERPEAAPPVRPRAGAQAGTARIASPYFLSISISKSLRTFI